MTSTVVRSVTVILRGDQDDDVLLEVAFRQACWHGCGVLVVKPWQPPPDADLCYAETAEQKELDGYLAGWQERYPEVGVAAELRVGGYSEVLQDCASEPGLLIVPVGRASPDQLDPVLDAVLAERSAPTVLVPEPAPAVACRPDRVLAPDRVGGRAG